MVESALGYIIERRVSSNRWEGVCQVAPGTNKYGTRRERDPLVAQDTQNREHHASARRVTCQNNGVGFLRLE